jgi:hypothetical protein
MKYAIAIALLLSTASVEAQTYVQRCTWSRGSYVCLFSESGGSDPRIIHVPQYGPDEQLTEQERIARRVRSCNSLSVVCLEAGQ